MLHGPSSNSIIVTSTFLLHSSIQSEVNIPSSASKSPHSLFLEGESVKVSSTSQLFQFALVDALGPFLANLVAADHDCAGWRNFQASRSPAFEEAACALLFENMV